LNGESELVCSDSLSWDVREEALIYVVYSSAQVVEYFISSAPVSGSGHHVLNIYTPVASGGAIKIGRGQYL